MAKTKNNSTDWLSILEVVSFIVSAAIEVVKKWKENEYVEEIKSETKGKEVENTSENQ